MTAYWKAVAVVLLAIILTVTLGKTEKDISVILSMAVCCIVIMIALQYLSEVIEFLWKLGNSTVIHNPYMDILLKISGVALMTELTELIGSDAGNSSIGKAMQILGNAVILFLSLPLFEAFLAVVQEIMGLI